MTAMIAVIVLMLGAMALEARWLARRQQWRELIAASAIWIVATTYAALVIAPIDLVSPSEIIMALLDLIYAWLKM
ncbi:MAG TPA: hypothetical protein PKO38_03340 [Bacillota bacterium]|jgi:uncharacterized membrane protein YdjX (TVP38/TMEM64 family)|nr:hypothetical protein [Bacillota bacterium]HOP69120.1 hypothetical protein [Bacillota bacterium]HQD06551.1 hypothetical protein [Bacillota bacterium]